MEKDDEAFELDFTPVCEKCRRHLAANVVEWTDSESACGGSYSRCGSMAHGARGALVDCFALALERQRLLIDKADRLAQKVMDLHSDKNNWPKEKEVYEAMVAYRAARVGVPVEVWKALTKAPDYSSIPDGPLFPEVKNEAH